MVIYLHIVVFVHYYWNLSFDDRSSLLIFCSSSVLTDTREQDSKARSWFSADARQFDGSDWDASDRTLQPHDSTTTAVDHTPSRLFTIEVGHDSELG